VLPAAAAPPECRPLDDSPAPVILVDPDGLVLYANRAMADALGVEPERLLGTEFALRCAAPPDARRLCEAVRAHGPVANSVLTLRRDDGTTLSMEFQCSPQRDAAGAATGVFAIGRDVSETQDVERRLRAASRYARSLIEASLDPLVTISTDGKIMDVNRATETATGLARDVLIGSDFSNYFTDPDEARAGYLRVFSHGHVNDYPLVLRSASGDLIDVLYNATVYHDDEGRVAGAFAAARDVTRLVRSQAALEQTHRESLLLGEMAALLQSCQDVAEAIPIVVAALQRLFPGTDGRVYMPPAVGELLEEAARWGRPLQEAREIDTKACWALRRGHVHDVAFEHSINPPCRHLEGESEPYLCIPLQAQGMVLGIVRVVFDAAEAGDGAARAERARHLAAMASDSISLALASLRLRERLQAMSIRDPLTGLYNRRFMEETLARELARRGHVDEPLAVAMLDCDNFKRFNDAHGHDAGDAVLKAIAHSMSEFRRGTDVACRYGGEEFVVVMPGATADQASRRLGDLAREIRQLQIQQNGERLPAVTLSIGLAVHPRNGRTGDELLKAADRALYRAKERGRDRLELASEE
jgi:diguanylate cyclase (GGDEF)-like protein/PAS domain S-box-containing protein